MKKIIILCFALGAFHTLGAQETLTLSQCLQMAVDNNLSLQSSRNEIAKGKYAISENQAKLYRIQPDLSFHFLMLPEK